MDDALDIHYAKTADGVHIAYATMGLGPPDLVLLIGSASHVQVFYGLSEMRHWWERLASFSRLVLIDERGAGMSDPVPFTDLPTLELRMDDLRVVLDALAIERAALCATDDGGPLAMLFAATWPERVDRLIVFDTSAALAVAPDYEIGFAEQQLDRFCASAGDLWGSPLSMKLSAPDLDEASCARFATMSASAASPGQAEAIFRRGCKSDVRPALPTITVPTLVIHRSGDRLYPIAMGRYIADHIEGSIFVELPGRDHFAFLGDVDSFVAEIEEFVTGQRSSYDIDRTLATVLFTDIVGSTQRAVELGDRRWRDLLDEHDGMVRRQLERFRGRAVKSTGDGVLATFDGPARAIRCACAIRDGARRLGLEIRSGLHTGECEVRSDDVSGIAVHTAARVTELAGSGEVLVSSVLPPLVAGSGIDFRDWGEHELKGVPGIWRLFAVES